MVAVADPQPGDVIVDPACGQGSTFIRAIAQVGDERRARQQIGCVGREIEPNVWTLAKVRLGLRGIAHDLGEPGDSLDSKGVDGALTKHGYSRFISDPGLGAQKLRRWTKRAIDLLADGGTGVLLVPADIVFPAADGSARGEWWARLQPHIDAVVFTPTDDALLVLRRDADRRKLLIQIHRMTSAATIRRHEEEHPGVPIPLDVHDPSIAPFMPAQLRLAAQYVNMPRAAEEKVDISTDDFVDCRTIDAITTMALGTPRWADSAPVRNTIVEKPEEKSKEHTLHAKVPRPEPTGQGHALRIPSRGSSSRRIMRGEISRQMRGSDVAAHADADVAALLAAEDELLTRARDAVELLRWLTDPEAFLENPKQGDPRIASALEGLTTEEMRRALRRLQLRLEGRETRGRRPRAD